MVNAAPLFPNGLSPLFSVFVNVNNAQTRKSALTGIADVVGGYLDEIVRERVAAKKHKQRVAPRRTLTGMEARRATEKLKEGARPRGREGRELPFQAEGGATGRFDLIALCPTRGVLPSLLWRFPAWYGLLVNLDVAHDIPLAFG